MPLLKVPDAVPGTPFEAIPVVRIPRWKETALWWPEHEALIVAEVVGRQRALHGRPRSRGDAPDAARAAAPRACAPTRPGTC